MLESFNDLEAVEVGLKMEKEGYVFYQTAASLAGNPQTEALYRKLAEDEKKHIERFSDYRDELMAGQGRDAQEDEVSTYIEKLVKTGVFDLSGRSAEQLEHITEDWQVIELAIKAEKDGILFYHEAAAKCENESGKKLFTWLIQEEKHHLAALGEIYEKLKN